MIFVKKIACIDCKNAYKGEHKVCCMAFPNGLPDNISQGTVDPRKLKECGNGYKFEPKDK